MGPLQEPGKRRGHLLLKICQNRPSELEASRQIFAEDADDTLPSKICNPAVSRVLLRFRASKWPLLATAMSHRGTHERCLLNEEVIARCLQA